MSLNVMKSIGGIAVVGLLLAGCAHSPTDNSFDRGDSFGYYVNLVWAATFGVEGYGVAWSYSSSSNSRATGRLADVDFTVSGASGRSIAGFNENLDATLVHLDTINGTDLTMTFPGNEAGTFVTGSTVESSPQVLIEMDGTRYTSESDLGRVELVLETYPELNGNYVGRVSGTLVSEDGEAAEFEASFEAPRRL